MTDLKKLSSDWIKLQYSKVEPRGADPLFWAYNELDDFCDDDPDVALDIILDILSNDSSKTMLANVGSGPLEDLLARHGSDVIDKIKHISESSLVLRQALGAVWKNSLDESVWSDVSDVADSSWDIDT